MTLIDPSTGKEWYKVDKADKEQVELAVKHAEAAWPAWAATPAVFRAAALRQYGELINTYAEEFIDVESRPIGKTRARTQGRDVHARRSPEEHR
ncbi:Aldehyde/histidinol dehydrogenase [Pterulicium gracile]|uniref:Aldehyde/histidinol dehydrogenase n=1 Tax=Pterulicium gracile TaxID=1884261 RepID=A0A5C3QHD5_9AGAR|nr:Aldehyde/histidinol dehydrogenase [Pterula gracilis]